VNRPLTASEGIVRTFDIAEDVGAKERHDQHGHWKRTVGQKFALAGVQKRPARTNTHTQHINRTLLTVRD